MKQFTVFTAILLGVSILAIWILSQTVPGLKSSPGAKFNAGDELPVPVTGAESRTIAPAPVYDASGTIVSLKPNGSINEVVIAAPAANVKIAPVYDANGNLLSDPSGTVSNAVSSEAMVAPVFDATGAVISDPSGTILNASNP